MRTKMTINDDRRWTRMENEIDASFDVRFKYDPKRGLCRKMFEPALDPDGAHTRFFPLDNFKRADDEYAMICRYLNETGYRKWANKQRRLAREAKFRERWGKKI